VNIIVEIIAFWLYILCILLDHFKLIDDFVAGLQIFKDAFSLGIKIISRISYDQEGREVLSSKALPDFNPDQVRWEMIGPVFENHFAIIYRFPVNLIDDLEYDSSKWS